MRKSSIAALPERHIKQKVLTLRLDDPTIQWLLEVADKKGLGISTLMRMWVLERLADEAPPKNGEWV